MISINATLFVQIIHFLVLVLILHLILFRPILKLMSERINYVDKIEKETEDIESNITQLASDRVILEKNTRREAGEKRSSFQKEGNKLSEKIFQDTREEIAAIRDDVDRDIAKQIEEARKSLQREATLLADELTEKVVDRRISY
ncbi:MAG: ATP synthase F0 subunit B [Deltaproteobacteria bacterium]|nr:ATP synthase F0 subunit B [Deltaproteobacteria bacterium]